MKKNIRNYLSFVSAIGLAIALGGLILLYEEGTLSPSVIGDNSPYTLTLDKDQNTFSETGDASYSSSITRGNDYYIDVGYYNYYNVDNAWGMLSYSGNLHNVSAINGIISMTFVTEGDAYLYMRWDTERSFANRDFSHGSAEAISFSNSYTYTFNGDKPNYFMLAIHDSGAPVTFSSIKIVYDCGTSSSDFSSEFKVGEATHIYSQVSLDSENSFTDNFTGNLDSSSWYVIERKWGIYANNGVRADNLFYSDDSLLFRSYGKYASSYIDSGACLVSKFMVKPGHYEVRMKPLPRLGAVSAMWLYNDVGGTLNQEIDIELPGGCHDALNPISFKSLLNTNYVTESSYISNDITAREATGGRTINLNDGEYHTFAFDWYTYPTPAVVYSVDGYVSSIYLNHIPTYENRIWLGVWCPNNAAFVGESLYEVDYMEVDYLTYTPFLEQEYVSYTPTVSGTSSVTPTYLESKPSVNMLSYNESAWNSSGTSSISGSSITLGSSSSIYQNIDSLYEGQTVLLSGSSSGANVTVSSLDANGEVLSSESMSLPSSYTPIEGAYSIRVSLSSSSGGTISNLSVIRQ